MFDQISGTSDCFQEYLLLKRIVPGLFSSRFDGSTSLIACFFDSALSVALDFDDFPAWSGHAEGVG